MRGETLEHWQLLCAQAANEHNPERLLELVREINRLVEEKYARLKEKPEGK